MKIISAQKRIRLPEYDYTNGWFFITNKTNNSVPYLTNLTHDLVKNELEQINKICHRVSLDYATIVPNHIHCILVLDNSDLSLSEIWRRFKARTTYIAKQKNLITTSLWQRNFYEHTIRNEKALDRIRAYIQNNPLKENLPLNEIYEKRIGN